MFRHKVIFHPKVVRTQLKGRTEIHVLNNSQNFTMYAATYSTTVKTSKCILRHITIDQY